MAVVRKPLPNVELHAIVRYASGPTALLGVVWFDDEWVYGLQCCGLGVSWGAILAVPRSSVRMQLEPRDLKEWRDHAPFRRCAPLPFGREVLEYPNLCYYQEQ